MIISISGRIGAGKDTIADILVTQHRFQRESFAGSLKDAITAIFGWDRGMIEGKTKEAREQREIIDKWWAKRLNIPHLSPRWVLQHLGTDVLRNYFHNDIWIASLEHKLLNLNQSDTNIVISDARFMNELNLLSNIGAKTVYISRGDAPIWWDSAKAAYIDKTAMEYMMNSGIHRSEWDHASFNFDTYIDNNGSLLDLQNQVDLLVRI